MSASKRKPFGKQRKAAKALLVLVRDSDAAAIERVKKVIHNFTIGHFISLMTAQHVIAREAGFSSWSDMLLQAAVSRRKS